MKRCPQCGRDYDVSMTFCLDDGSELLYGPAAEANEPATAILHGGTLPFEAPTIAAAMQTPIICPTDFPNR